MRPWLIICIACLLLVAAAPSHHQVRRGDTLYGISRHYHISLEALLKENQGKLSSTSILRIGQRIELPSSSPSSTKPLSPLKPPISHSKKEKEKREKRVYIVTQGDTLWSIGKRFDMTVAELQQLNSLTEDDLLAIGQKLVVLAPSTSMQAPKNLHQTPSQKNLKKTHYLFINSIKKELKAPRIRSNRWKHIVIHHSGTTSGNAAIFDYYHRKKSKMENGLAYHFVIGNGTQSGDGEVEVGDRWTQQLAGGHLADEVLNDNSIGICFVGNFNQNRPTKKQIAAAIELISYLREKITPTPHFKAHREINPKPTECPGQRFPIRLFHKLFESKNPRE